MQQRRPCAPWPSSHQLGEVTRGGRDARHRLDRVHHLEAERVGEVAPRAVVGEAPRANGSLRGIGVSRRARRLRLLRRTPRRARGSRRRCGGSTAASASAMCAGHDRAVPRIEPVVRVAVRGARRPSRRPPCPVGFSSTCTPCEQSTIFDARVARAVDDRVRPLVEPEADLEIDLRARHLDHVARAAPRRGAGRR